MSEPDPIESKEVVMKGPLEELAEAVDAFGSEARDVDQEIEAWTRRIREGKKARVFDTPAPSPEVAAGDDEVAQAGVSEANADGVQMEEASIASEPAEGETEARRQWYYASGSERKGPIGDPDLRRLLTSGRLPGATPVWTKGQGDWISAKKAGLVKGDEMPVWVLETESKKDCPGCGIANRQGAKFCRGCGDSLSGVKVISRVRRRPCPSCQVPMTPEARFCRSCGARLR